MNLLGLQLQKVGLKFISACAGHRDGARTIYEIACETAEDAARVDEWAARDGYSVTARVATPEEVAEWKAVAW